MSLDLLVAANRRRTDQAAAATAEAVVRAMIKLGKRGTPIPAHLEAAGRLRVQHAALSLRELADLAQPPVTKDVLASRIRRLLELADKFCWFCDTARSVGVCCAAHNKRLCHRCYRRTHFVEVCTTGCTQCEREGLPVSMAKTS